MWNVIFDSVEGTSHKKDRLGCQDASGCAEVKTFCSSVLCLVCSDGAGSAKYASYASLQTCQQTLRNLTGHFSKGLGLLDLRKELILDWVRTLRATFEKQAVASNCNLNDFACTLMMAAISWDGAVFAQIGDGAIVRRQGDEYKTIFWPDSGEYLNTTWFVTSPTFEANLKYDSQWDAPQELAIFTDGLQMLSLDFPNQRAHRPFFDPLFASLRSGECPSELVPQLSQFLQSDKINARTDDDKTLILASLNHDSLFW